MKPLGPEDLLDLDRYENVRPALRDAVTWDPNPGTSAVAFPITFPLYALEHIVFYDSEKALA